MRAFLVKRGDWWHTVPGLQEKSGVMAGPVGDLHLSPPKAPLSHGQAWEIYLQTETPEQNAKKHSIQYAYTLALWAAGEAPHDEKAPAEYLAAKQAYDEWAATEDKALEQLGRVKEVQVAA